jgi:hypothetical protein
MRRAHAPRSRKDRSRPAGGGSPRRGAPSRKSHRQSAARRQAVGQTAGASDPLRTESASHLSRSARVTAPHARAGRAVVRSASRSSFLFEHDLFGKPDSTFPDHALVPKRWRARRWRRGSGRLGAALLSQRGEILLTGFECIHFRSGRAFRIHREPDRPDHDADNTSRDILSDLGVILVREFFCFGRRTKRWAIARSGRAAPLVDRADASNRRIRRQ